MICRLTVRLYEAKDIMTLKVTLFAINQIFCYIGVYKEMRFCVVLLVPQTGAL